MTRSLVFALVLPALAPAAPVPKGKVAGPYFPTTVGDTREYEWRTGDKVDEGYTDAVTGVEKRKDGATHVTVRRSYSKGLTYTTVIGVSADALTRVSEGGEPLADPTVLLKLPPTVGTEWESAGAKYVVAAEEEVSVQAGKFKTVKVEMTSGGGKTILWFAPAVGLLKMAPGGGERALELKAFMTGNGEAKADDKKQGPKADR